VSDRETRRAERSRTWSSHVFRDGAWNAMHDADVAFWLRIPIDERAEMTWKLSEEGFAFAAQSEAGGAVFSPEAGEAGAPREERSERRLSRSAFRVVRR
jgi:hypothetical protein